MQEATRYAHSGLFGALLYVSGRGQICFWIKAKACWGKAPKRPRLLLCLRVRERSVAFQFTSGSSGFVAGGLLHGPSIVYRQSLVRSLSAMQNVSALSAARSLASLVEFTGDGKRRQPEGKIVSWGANKRIAETKRESATRWALSTILTSFHRRGGLGNGHIRKP